MGSSVGEDFVRAIVWPDSIGVAIYHRCMQMNVRLEPKGEVEFAFMEEELERLGPHKFKQVLLARMIQAGDEFEAKVAVNAVDVARDWQTMRSCLLAMAPAKSEADMEAART